MNCELGKVGRYQFVAEPFHCDFSKQLFLGHMGNHMLNAADYHSHDRGFGMSYLNTINKTWVLSRLAIEMNEMPEQYTKFYVETWVESAMRYFTQRNFRVVSEDGQKVYGYGRSVWAMIDTETRKPADIFAVKDGDIKNWIVPDGDCPIDKGGRVKLQGEPQLIRTIDTYYNDIDVNGHVNSVKYIEHVLDLYDVEWYKAHKLNRFEIAYVAETYQGERLNFYKDEGHVWRITKTDKQGEETEACRCAMLFS